MKSLKELLEENKLFHYEDIEIIKKWFTENNLEELGLKMIPELAASKSTKIQKQLDYARTWIPIKIDMNKIEGGRRRYGSVSEQNHYMLYADNGFTRSFSRMGKRKYSENEFTEIVFYACCRLSERQIRHRVQRQTRMVRSIK